MKRNIAGPLILKDEMREAIRKMKSGKATNPNSISLELSEALEDPVIDKIATLLNKIGSDFTRHLHICIYCTAKEIRGNGCELHRMISLMSLTTKVFKNDQNTCQKSEITEEQCGFVEGKGTANAIYIV